MEKTREREGQRTEREHFQAEREKTVVQEALQEYCVGKYPAKRDLESPCGHSFLRVHANICLS